jgi:putative SbcD/Mre11-related phosphoesterase
MKAIPIYGVPALKIRSKENVLVVADLHLGIESELARRGVTLPSQVPKIKERLLKLIERERSKRLIFLGDVKHNVPIATWQEWRELPAFFEELAERVRVEVVPGNHDGGLEGMVPSGVKIHEVGGVLLGRKIGLIHGHAWPSPALLKAELIVAAHNHPAVEFRDELGGRTIEPAWLRCKLSSPKLPKKLKKAIEGDGPEVLVMPAFGELVGGAAVNRAVPEEFLGPMFKSGAVRLDEAEVYLLDGTSLGTVGNLRRVEA